MLIIFLNKVHFFYFCCIIHKDVGVKRYFGHDIFRKSKKKGEQYEKERVI